MGFWAKHRGEVDKLKLSKMEKFFMQFGGDNSGGGAPPSSDSGALSRTVVNLRNGVVSREALAGDRLHETQKLPAFFRTLTEDTERKLPSFVLTKSLQELVYNNRDLPVNCSARCPPNLGNIPELRRVQSEPRISQYDTTTSTMSFADRRALQKRFRTTKGVNKLHKRVLEVQGNLGSLATLSRLANTLNPAPKTSSFHKWHIPPRPQEQGLGELLANRSLSHYKVVARERSIDPHAPNQKDCIGTRWTGIG